MELLYTFIECSIAILAFASIVAQFKKNKSEKWNIHQYQGIIGHSIQAFIYSCLPLLLKEFLIAENMLWSICVLILGILTFLQGVSVFFMDKITKVPIKILMMVCSSIILGIQLLYVLGIVKSGIAVFNVGVFWHLFQSLILVSVFIMNAEMD